MPLPDSRLDDGLPELREAQLAGPRLPNPPERVLGDAGLDYGSHVTAVPQLAGVRGTS